MVWGLVSFPAKATRVQLWSSAAQRTEAKGRRILRPMSGINGCATGCDDREGDG